MREADFAGAGWVAATDQRHGRRRMVWLTVGAQTEMLRAELSGQREHGGRFAGSREIERRQQAGQAGGEHRFARARWTGK